jgi:hypothetical protein
MKKISKTKLALRTESIRNLGDQDLVGAQGGKPAQTQTQCAGICDTFHCATTACGGH